MRQGRALLIVMVAILGMATWRCEATPPPVRILPLGDSITQGGRSDREEYTYRLPLQRLLVNAGVNFDFIGSLNTGLERGARWPNVAPGVRFDPDHEGHYGWRTAEVRDQLQAWLQFYSPPNIALIHLGTNDQNAADRATSEAEANRLLTGAIVEPLKDIIRMLRARNPRIVILVGHLNFDHEAAQAIRRLVEAMAARLSTQDSPIVTVHHYRGFIAAPGAGSDTFDWLHPTPRGQEKMAIAWFNAMKPYLRSSN